MKSAENVVVETCTAAVNCCRICTFHKGCAFFTARRYASAVYAMVCIGVDNRQKLEFCQKMKRTIAQRAPHVSP